MINRRPRTPRRTKMCCALLGAKRRLPAVPSAMLTNPIIAGVIAAPTSLLGMTVVAMVPVSLSRRDVERCQVDRGKARPHDRTPQPTCLFVRGLCLDRRPAFRSSPQLDDVQVWHRAKRVT